ncbi:MAG: B12-binding domain-containing radical SAM protein [Candidatus Binatia bacterium]
MARVALIKLFTGLNLGVSQLSGDLQRAGHDSRVIYLKDFLVAPKEDGHRYLVTDYALTLIAERGREYVWNYYRPFTEREYELLFEALEDFDPQLIGFSLTSLTMQAAAEVTGRLKQRFDLPIIWGGPGPTVEPEVAIEHADMVCIGEGEELIVELAEHLDRGTDYTGVRGMWTRRGDSIVRNPAAPYPELDSIAIPDFEISRTIHIGDDQIQHDVYPLLMPDEYPIMTQRGCPFSCSFCIESVYQDTFGKKNSLRRRSVDVVIEELVAAKRKFKLTHIMFYDDVFTVNPRWLREFAPRYKAEIGLPFWCYTYPTTTRRDEILMLKDAGLRSITMGIQSGSEAMLKEFHRPVAREKAIEAAKVIIECGVECYFDMITKVHFETEADCRQTFDFLVDFPQQIRSIGFGAMVNFPKYGYTEAVAERGATLSLSDADYRYYHKLYLLTRTELPRWAVRALGESRLVRRFPSLLDRFLPDKLPSFFLTGDTAGDVVDTPHAQAIVPGGDRDRSAAAQEARAQA